MKATIIVVIVNFQLFFFYAEVVPKKILDLMNAEKLTRENVASHLQAFTTSPVSIKCKVVFLYGSLLHYFVVAEI